MSEWISVEDKTPRTGRGCIGWLVDVEDNEGDYGFVIYEEKDGEFLEHTGEIYQSIYGKTVTHWIPLPEPPK